MQSEKKPRPKSSGRVQRANHSIRSTRSCESPVIKDLAPIWQRFRLFGSELRNITGDNAQTQTQSFFFPIWRHFSTMTFKIPTKLQLDTEGSHFAQSPTKRFHFRQTRRHSGERIGQTRRSDTHKQVWVRDAGNYPGEPNEVPHDARPGGT